MGSCGPSGLLPFWVEEDGMSGDRIRIGDLVMVEELEDVSDSDIVLIRIDEHKHLLRRVQKGSGTYLLIPSNVHAVVECRSADEVAILGKVINLHIAY